MRAESGCLNILTFERPTTFSVSKNLSESPDNGETPDATVRPRFY